MTLTTPAGESADGEVTIAAYTSCPDRTVFTESGNPDGWISTDLTVESER